MKVSHKGHPVNVEVMMYTSKSLIQTSCRLLVNLIDANNKLNFNDNCIGSF